MTEITRVTMIKIPSEEQQALALEGFKTFTQNQKKVRQTLSEVLIAHTLNENLQDGKPYILSMEAGPAFGHVRDQGYTFVCKSVFKDKADMDFYETQCEGHQEFKNFLKKYAPVEGLMTVYFTPGVSYKI